LSGAAPDFRSCDIYLNDNACWRNIPEAAWKYTIGGYQVLKKWLSYREKPLLGRGLTPDEVRYVTEVARRLAALTALQAALDANYRGVIQTAYPRRRRLRVGPNSDSASTASRVAPIGVGTYAGRPGDLTASRRWRLGGARDRAWYPRR
jgi:hypothetical protein